MKLRTVLPAAAVFLALQTPARPHHSNVAYEVTKVLTLTGVVKEFRWTNPHTWIHVTVEEGNSKVEWALEGRAPNVLQRSGWSRTILKPGEKITVDYSPSRNGAKIGIVARVTKEGGVILANAPGEE